MTINAGQIEYTISADTRLLLSGINDANNALNGLNGGFGRTDRAAISASDSISRVGSASENTSRIMGRLSGVASSLMAALSVQQVASYADAWTELNNKVSNSIRTGETQAEVMQRIFDISQATQSTLNGTATLYSRLERGTRTYNTSAEDLARLTTIINQGFAVSGATAQEAENAIIQLSQGIASGVLRGEEFNSVSEQGSRLMIALADSMGVSIGQLRSMAAEGKLTTDVVVNGLLSQGDAIGKEFANTTVSIAKGLQVAGNNITKFFGENSTVKSFAAGFRDSVVSVSENLEALSSVLIIVAGVMGSRYVGALTMATSAKIADIAASRQQAVAENQAAQAALVATNSVQRKALADKEAALSSLALAQAEYNVAKGSAAEMLALDALIAAKTRATAVSLALAEAETAQAAASARAAAAARAASVGVGLARNALALIGGPAGAAMLAAGAIFYFWQKAQQAKQESIDFADSLDGLTAKMKEMSAVQMASAIAKTEQSILDQQDAIASLRAEYDQLEQKKTFIEQAAQIRGAAAVADDLADVNRNLAVQADKVEQAENKLSRTTSSLGLLRAQANGQFREGIDLLRRDGEEAGVAAGMMGKLGDMINFAAKAKEKFNSSSLMVMRSEDGDKLLSILEKQNSLLSITDKKERAVAEARQAALDAGVDAHSNQIRQIEEAAAKRYDLQEADSAVTKSTKEGTKAVDEAAQSLSRQQAALSRLNTGYAEGSLELAQYDAVVALGNKATDEQIAKARSQAKAIWEVTNAIKNRAQAEQAKRFTDQEIAANKTSPDAVTGAVQDPTAQIALQEQQKLAALQQYQQMGVLSVQQYEDAKTAIQEQAANARRKIAVDEANAQTEAIGSILGSASQGFDSLASIIENTSGKSSGAYVAMFAAAKAFAIAQSTLSLNTAIMQAMADPTALTPAQKMANYAAIASAGASLLSNIASVTMSGGRRYGGTVSAGNAYRVNEDGRSEIFQTAGGQQAFIPNQSGKIIPADKVGGGGGVVQHITFEINTTGGIDDATMAKMAQMMKQVSLSTIRDQQRPNGLLRRS
ncbi:tape measure protein [Enterobacter hormaechei]|uniref:tape measure protein n=1 Tax=Enterobacter hormaechei TaxID=158836 RepID=UPI000799CE0C|nr:tape measure protein [Enterobacter hormaechei]MBJ6408390.1 tape measure protein [Enterobacter hormaechei]SAF37096.1 lambda family phage tail tape measure protein [Enterobacter hormaechei]VAG40704.1 lambda family phage tail tape measure protein [Enterobacter hormaechei]